MAENTQPTTDVLADIERLLTPDPWGTAEARDIRSLNQERYDATRAGGKR